MIGESSDNIEVGSGGLNPGAAVSIPGGNPSGEAEAGAAGNIAVNASPR